MPGGLLDLAQNFEKLRRRVWVHTGRWDNAPLSRQWQACNATLPILTFFLSSRLTAFSYMLSSLLYSPAYYFSSLSPALLSSLSPTSLSLLPLLSPALLLLSLYTTTYSCSHPLSHLTLLSPFSYISSLPYISLSLHLLIYLPCLSPPPTCPADYRHQASLTPNFTQGPPSESHHAESCFVLGFKTTSTGAFTFFTHPVYKVLNLKHSPIREGTHWLSKNFCKQHVSSPDFISPLQNRCTHTYQTNRGGIKPSNIFIDFYVCLFPFMGWGAA